jgi:hypothetical protein
MNLVEVNNNVPGKVLSENFEKHDIKLCHCFVVTLCDDGTESSKKLLQCVCIKRSANGAIVFWYNID